MLWQIEDTPHRVLGSIHALPNGQDFPTWVRRGYTDAHRLVFEADHTDKSILEIGVDRAGTHLNWPGSQETYDRAKQLMNAIGNEVPFDGLRPWRAAFFVSFALLGSKLNVSPACGVETVLRAYAEKQGLAIEYLEPSGRAFELFDSCDEPYSCLRLFQHLVADPTFALREFSRILNAWLTANTAEMATVLRERLALFPKIFAPIIIQRNQKWLPNALRFITDTTPTTFVVGALHTVGSGSFVEQLDSAGYRLTPNSLNKT